MLRQGDDVGNEACTTGGSGTPTALLDDNRNASIGATLRLLHSIGRTTKAWQDHVRHELRAHGLHLGQDAFLQQLAQLGGRANLTDLSNKLRVRPPTITKTVEKLIKQGHIIREVNGKDRRRVWVALSAKGEDTVLRIEATWRRLSQRIAHALPIEERDATISGLQKFEAAVVREADRVR